MKSIYTFIEKLHLSLSSLRALISSSTHCICDETLRIAFFTYLASSFLTKRGAQSSLISNWMRVRMSRFKSNISAHTWIISSLLFLLILSSEVTISRYPWRVLFKINPWQIIALFASFTISSSFLLDSKMRWLTARYFSSECFKFLALVSLRSIWNKIIYIHFWRFQQI